MPPRKRAAKAPVKPKTDQKVIVIDTRETPIAGLQMFHKNPRVGNVEEIAKSLHVNGQYKPIIVNVGTQTGRENEILAGNHTYLGARREVAWQQDKITHHKPVWDTILASYVDVDDETAARIVLADNKTADLGEYDDAIIKELFDVLPSATGTGYTDEEFDKMMGDIEDMGGSLEEASRGIEDFTGGMPDDIEPEGDNSASSRSMPDRMKDDETEEQREAAHARGASRPDHKQEPDLEDIPVDAELQVVLELKEDNIYKGDNRWGIPELRLDMIPDRLPSPIATWGGKEATPDDGETWWLYNYSLGGRSGLPIDRTIMSFFTYDAKFENWWDTPAYYASRYMSEGLKYIIVPDFSFYYTETRAHHLWSVYKAQWMGRFFQEAGLKVIPRFQFDYTDPDALEISTLGIPHETPVLAMSMQNVEDEKVNGPKMSAVLAQALEDIDPGQVLYYSGPPGKRAMEAAVEKSSWGGEVLYVENYAAVRRHNVFDKADGKKKLTAKQRKALEEKHGGRKKTQREIEAARDEEEEDDADE